MKPKTKVLIQDILPRTARWSEGKKPCTRYGNYRGHTWAIYSFVSVDFNTQKKRRCYKAPCAGPTYNGDTFGHEDAEMVIAEAKLRIDESIVEFLAEAKATAALARKVRKL